MLFQAWPSIEKGTYLVHNNTIKTFNNIKDIVFYLKKVMF